MSSNDGHSHGDIDPHIWIDPMYAKEIAKTIKDTLVEHTPENDRTCMKKISGS